MYKDAIKKKFLWVVVLLIGNFSFCSAQFNATAFEDFSQTIVNPYLINPSASDSSYKYNIRSQYISETGLIKNVSRFYIDGDMRVKASNKNVFHFIGLQVVNSNFGDYIHKSRLQGRYSWYSKISQNAYLSSGISLGFVNYAFLASNGGAGGSDYGPDGMAGLHYLRKKTSVGISILQLFSTVLQPIAQSFSLPKLYSLDVSQKIFIAPKATLTVYSVLQHSEQQSLLYSLGLMTDVSKVFVGISNFSLRKTSISFGVKQIPLLGTKFMFYYTYSLYHSSFPLPNNTMEFFISVQK
jgi:hypothetical protein